MGCVSILIELKQLHRVLSNSICGRYPKISGIFQLKKEQPTKVDYNFICKAGALIWSLFIVSFAIKK